MVSIVRVSDWVSRSQSKLTIFAEALRIAAEGFGF